MRKPDRRQRQLLAAPPQVGIAAGYGSRHALIKSVTAAITTDAISATKTQSNTALISFLRGAARASVGKVRRDSVLYFCGKSRPASVFGPAHMKWPGPLKTIVNEADAIDGPIQ
jgi:hypothetical protein